MTVSNDIVWVGVNDRKIDLFESQFVVPNGMAYNSYIILDEKIAVLDSVERNFTEEWFYNLDKALNGRAPDYLIVQHMEPDHSSSIVSFMNRYLGAAVVSSDAAFRMMKNFYGVEFEGRRISVSEVSKLILGRHVLSFVAAPMVHWPEVIMTYDSTEKVLFSADAFGKFGTTDTDEDWACEARRYYFGIIGKYGPQVQKVIQKLDSIQIEKICPLHGPVLTDNLGYYTGLYRIWSSYTAEAEGVFIAYTSVYGNTRKAAEELASMLKEGGCPKVSLSDLARSDMAENIEDAFKYSKLVLATTTYNTDIFPSMREFIQNLVERGYRNRTVGFIENGSWAPQALKVMRQMLNGCKDIRLAENSVRIMSSLNDESRSQLKALAKEMLEIR